MLLQTDSATRHFIKKNVVCVLLSTLFAACNGDGNKKPEEPVRKPLVKDTTVQTEKKPVVAVNPDSSYLEFVFKPYELVNIKHVDSSIQVDLRYASTSNFLKINLYDGLRNAYLNCETAIKLANAQHFLKEKNSRYSLLLLDAARPLHVQQMMWDSTRLDSAKKIMYLAAPYQTSLHNYGCAVDVTILDLDSKKELDMGTGYDDFDLHSKPSYEWIFLKDSSLSKNAYENRLLLRNIMKKAGLRPITSEWWHFSTCTKEEAVLKFKLIK